MPDGVVAAGHRLQRLFRPQSIAVVGASPSNPWNLQMLENVRRMGFEGPLAAVNPKYEEVAGEPCYPDLRSLPEPPDAVLLAVGRDRVVPTLEEAAEAGARGAVVVAGGFQESGPDGRALQARLRAVADAADMPVIGPNCQGVISVAGRSALYLDHIAAGLPQGRVGVVSQSGTVTTALLNNARGVRYSFAVSSGNEAVVEAAEVLEFLVEDPDTDTIVCFLETIRSPDRFLAACEAARAASKPVIALKAGRTEAALQVAIAHTGALAAPYRQVAARLQRAGVLAVGALEELLETAVAVRAGARPGRRVAAITLSGGQAELLHDTVEGLGIEFAPLAAETRARIEAIGVRPANPLDAWGSPDFDADYPRMVQALRDDPGVDAVVALVEATAAHPTGEPEIADQVADALVALQDGCLKQHFLLTTISGNVDVALADRLAGHGIPLLSGLRQGLVALGRAADWAVGRAAPPPAPLPPAAVAPPDIGAQPFSGLAGLQLLQHAGVDVVATIPVDGADAAARAADEFGYPVVVKTADASVLHKTELRAIAVGLRSEAAVRRAAREIGSRLPDAPLLVQRQEDGGLEMILGLQRDPLLGTFVLLGLGGIWAEILDDVALRPVPLAEGDAEAMIAELRAAPLLAGARGREPLDRAALVRAVERLAALGDALGDRVKSLDVNPLLVSAHGAIALDALVVPRPEEPA